MSNIGYGGLRTATQLTEWVSQGACVALALKGFDWWYPAERHTRGPASAVPYFEARRICSTCTVRKKCLEYALAAGETAGMWGGLTPDERRPLHRKRRRASGRGLAKKEATGG
jgi:WhiB family redox-sensing transcriptional regulator